MGSIERRISRLEQQRNTGTLYVFKSIGETTDAAVERHCRERETNVADYGEVAIFGWLDPSL